jgi:hypothetical protein
MVLEPQVKPVSREFWSRPWVTMWGVNSVIVLSLIPFLSFYRWSIVALLGFAAPEIWAVTHPGSWTPPLTSVIARHTKRWQALTAIGVLWGMAGSYWFDMPNENPFAWAGYVGIGWWLFDHFTQTFESEERRGRS